MEGQLKKNSSMFRRDWMAHASGISLPLNMIMLTLVYCINCKNENVFMKE